MHAHLIIIASELLQAKIQDKNIHYLARQLQQNGHIVDKCTIVHDNPSDILEALKIGWEQADLVITSGGLGPTKDDLTKEMIAKFLDQKIVFKQQALDVATENYRRNQRVYDDTKMQYHLMPENVVALNNPTGHAPGLYFKDEQGRQLFSLPGVPHELQSMMDQVVIPLIQDKTNSPLELVIARTFGIPESQIFSELCPNLWSDLEKLGAVSSLPHLLGVDVGVAITGNKKEIEQKKQMARDYILQSALKDKIWTWGQEDLNELIVKTCLAKQKTLGMAESCSGGLTSSLITDVAGSSQIFKGSIISYSNEMKIKLLKVDPNTIEQFGVVSVEVAREMAEGARKVLETDFAISFTGIAGPTGGDKNNPVGTVAIAVAGPKKTTTELFHFKGTRLILKQRFAQMGLYMLLQELNTL